MAKSPFSKIQPGEVLPGLPADAWNRFLDVANIVRGGGDGGGPGFGNGFGSGNGLPPGVVLVKNTTADDRAQFEILTISGILFGSTDNIVEFKTKPCLKGIATGTPPEKFVILQEPIGAGKIGRGMVCGVTAVQVDMVTSLDPWADVISADSTKLRSGPFGSARILYAPAGTGTVWALVSIEPQAYCQARGKLASDCSSDGTGTLTIWSGAKGSESSTSQTVSVHNTSSCTVKGTPEFATAVYNWHNAFWELRQGKTS